MADFRAYHEVVAKFFLETCGLCPSLNIDALQGLINCAEMTAERIRASSDTSETDVIPITTGSTAELYIQPMLSCVGDVDVMFYRSDELAIPAGTPLPDQLPDEFDSCVVVFEIVDSEFPGYVYLVSSYLLTECIDDGKYNPMERQNKYTRMYKIYDDSHGPASMTRWSSRTTIGLFFGRVAGKDFSRDYVYCVRCLSWPTQATNWPTRHRNYGWPDSATVDRVVSNGCDVVPVAHRQCRRDEWKRRAQHRLSFSRAEVILLNSWTPVQQIVYHMLRVYVKIERLTDSAENSDAATLSNYHIKTLMLWACELKPRIWWTDDLNLVRLSVDLLHTLAVWLADVRCPHYFINNCNLFDHPDNWYCSPLLIASKLRSETEASLIEWFINNYIRKCAQLCPENSQLFDDVSSWKHFQKSVSAVVDWRLNTSLRMAFGVFTGAQYCIAYSVDQFRYSLTLRSYWCWMRDLIKIDQRLCMYFTANIFLHVAYKTTRNPLTDEFLDVLWTTCLQSNDVGLRRCLNARHSSVLSLSQAAMLMKVVANNARSTVQLIEIELSKAYLYRALRCKDSDSDSIYCLANVYLAVLYYSTGQYQRAIDHCTLVTRSQDHSQCSSHVVKGELLPKIDDEIDTVLGLAVFYQYLRTAALNKQQTQHVSVFTTELFAHYLHIRCLSITTKCRQLKQILMTEEVQQFQRCKVRDQQIFPADVLLVNFTNRAKCAMKGQRHKVVSGQATPVISHSLGTSELTELLQQSALDHLRTFRQLEADLLQSVTRVVTTDFKALFAYKCGEYQRCLQLSTRNVRALIGVETISGVFAYPEFIQLMDDDIVSLIGLTVIVNPSCRDNHVHSGIHQLYLSLYLMTQCQMKLHHSLTSLAQTLNLVEDARRDDYDDFVLNQLLLQLIERKILLYISREKV